jgi:hypothetical protein
MHGRQVIFGILPKSHRRGQTKATAAALSVLAPLRAAAAAHAILTQRALLVTKEVFK